MLAAAWDYLLAHPQQFAKAFAMHVALSAAALALATAIAFPLGVAAARRPALALAAVSVANLGRTLPSLAVLALVMPLLGTGFAPSLFALTLLALPPLLLNTIVGLQGVDPDVVDAARGMGMTPRTILRRIELPLALPVMFAGLRTAAVQVISGAVLAAFIGGGGLGDFIATGIGVMDMSRLLVGAVPIAILALTTEFVLGRVEKLLFSERAAV